MQLFDHVPQDRLDGGFEIRSRCTVGDGGDKAGKSGGDRFTASFEDAVGVQEQARSHRDRTQAVADGCVLLCWLVGQSVPGSVDRVHDDQRSNRGRTPCRRPERP